MVKKSKIRIGKTTGIIEWYISEDKGYCIIEENKSIVYVAKEGDTIIHHCSKSINKCMHIDKLSQLYRLQDIPFFVRERSFESAKKASTKILAELLIEGKITVNSPIQLLRVFHLLSRKQFRMLWKKVSLGWIDQFPLERMFELTGVAMSTVRQNPVMKKRSGGITRSIRIIEEELFNKHLVAEIETENWKTLLKEVHNTYRSKRHKVLEDIKKRVNGFWKDRDEDIVQTMFMIHCIDAWVKDMEKWSNIDPVTPLTQEITTYLQQFKNSSSKVVKNKIGLALALANRIPLSVDLKKLRLRKLELRKYVNEIFGNNNETRLRNAITLDDFFIFLLERLEKRPIYDFPIRRYYDNVYLPESILMDYPLLRFILERIKQENYLTYDDVTNHLKLFKWLGGEKIQSNYKERNLGTSNIIIPSNAFIAQWDVRSNQREKDILYFHYNGRTYELEFTEALKMGIIPFAYTVCIIEKAEEIKIAEIITAEAVLETIKDRSIEIVSTLLPWYLLTSNQTIELTQLNKGIRECKEKWFVYGSQILGNTLQEFLESGLWHYDPRKYEEIRQAIINDEFKYGKEELWDIVPKHIQRIMAREVPENETRDMLLMEGIKVSSDIYTALEYIIKNLGEITTAIKEDYKA